MCFPFADRVLPFFLKSSRPSLPSSTVHVDKLARLPKASLQMPWAGSVRHVTLALQFVVRVWGWVWGSTHAEELYSVSKTEKETDLPGNHATYLLKVDYSALLFFLFPSSYPSLCHSSLSALLSSSVTHSAQQHWQTEHCTVKKSQKVNKYYFI